MARQLLPSGEHPCLARRQAPLSVQRARLADSTCCCPLLHQQVDQAAGGLHTTTRLDMQGAEVCAHLHRDADATIDGVGRLRQDGQVGGAAAAADGAAAAVEQRQLDVILLRQAEHRHSDVHNYS